MYKDRPVVECQNACEWRAWLESNFQGDEGIWLVLYKKSSPNHNMSYEEARNEALCFGWIDSKPNRRDEESWYQYFAKRNPKSNWSKVNKNVVAELLKADRMAAPGIEMVELAKRVGTWDALNDVDNLVVPNDLQALFDKHPQAWAHWQNFPPSAKRGILEWIFTAKRSTTRSNRIEKTVSLAKKNIRANQLAWSVS